MNAAKRIAWLYIEEATQTRTELCEEIIAECVSMHIVSGKRPQVIREDMEVQADKPPGPDEPAYIRPRPKPQPRVTYVPEPRTRTIRFGPTMTVVSKNGVKSIEPIPFEINESEPQIRTTPSDYFKSLRHNLFDYLNSKKVTFPFDCKPEKVSKFLVVLERIANEEQYIHPESRAINASWISLEGSRRNEIIDAARLILDNSRYVRNLAALIRKAAEMHRSPFYTNLFETISDHWLPQKAFEWFDTLADFGTCEDDANERFKRYMDSYQRVLITCPYMGYATNIDTNRIVYEIFTTVANEPVGNGVIDRYGGSKSCLPSTMAWNTRGFLDPEYRKCPAGLILKELASGHCDEVSLQEIFDRLEATIVL